MHEKGTRTLASMLATANDWNMHEFGGSANFLGTIQGSVRRVFVLGGRHCDVWNRIPFLFGRLDKPGVRDLCLAQYSEALPADHNDVSNQLLAEGSELRADFENMNNDGSGMSPAIETIHLAIKNMPYDDTVDETPHSILRKVQIHSRAAGWPWAAATINVGQNLDNAQLLPFDHQGNWDSFSCVVNPPWPSPSKCMLAKTTG